MLWQKEYAQVYVYTTYDELRGTPRYKRGASYFILKKTSLQKET